MKLSLERIRNQVTGEIFERGERLFRDNKVKLYHIDIEKFEAEIEAAHTYTVTVQEIGENLYSRCSCPYWTTCKHVVAALLEAKEWYDENGGEMQLTRSHPSWKKFLDKIADLDPDAGAHHPAQQWRVVYFLDLNGESWSITPKKAYVKKNQFLGRFVNLGRVDLNSRELIFSPNDPIIVSFIQKRENQNYSFYNNRFFGNSQYKDTQIFHYKYGSRLGPLFDLLKASQIYSGPYEDQLSPIRFSPIPAVIHMRLHKVNGSFHLLPRVQLDDHEEDLNASYKILTEQPIWLLKDQVLYQVENLQNAALLIPFTKSNITLEIPETDFPAFLESFYTRLRGIISLPLPDSLQIERIDSISEKRIYLEESERHLDAFLRFAYRNFEVDLTDPNGSILRQDGDQVVEIVRDRDAENQARQRLLQTGLKEETKGGLSIIDTRALQWLFSYLPELVNEGYVFYGRENLQRYHIRTGTPNVRVAVSSNIDWFDLNIEIDIEGIALALKELRRAVRQNIRYVKLADQSIAQLPEEWLQKFRYLLNVTIGQDDQIKASPLHVTLIDTLFEDAQTFKADAQYYSRLKQLSSFEGVAPQSVPSSLVKILRNYQKSGYDWLYF
ncbi:MAG: hypothetical protein EHM72_08380, partial [Calditrichaeota bacterium]